MSTDRHSRPIGSLSQCAANGARCAPWRRSRSLASNRTSPTLKRRCLIPAADGTRRFCPPAGGRRPVGSRPPGHPPGRLLRGSTAALHLRVMSQLSRRAPRRQSVGTVWRVRSSLLMCDCVQPFSNSSMRPSQQRSGLLRPCHDVGSRPLDAPDGHRGDSDARRIRCRTIRKNATRCTGESSFQ